MNIRSTLRRIRRFLFGEKLYAVYANGTYSVFRGVRKTVYHHERVYSSPADGTGTVPSSVEMFAELHGLFSIKGRIRWSDITNLTTQKPQ